MTARLWYFPPFMAPPSHALTAPHGCFIFSDGQGKIAFFSQVKNDSLLKVWGNVIASSIWRTRRNTTPQQTSRCFCFLVFSMNFYLNLTIIVHTGTLGLRTLVEGCFFFPLPFPEECFLGNVWGFICGVYWTDGKREFFSHKNELIIHWNVYMLSLVSAIMIFAYILLFSLYDDLYQKGFKNKTALLRLKKQLEFTWIFIIDTFFRITQKQLQWPKAIKICISQPNTDELSIYKQSRCYTSHLVRFQYKLNSTLTNAKLERKNNYGQQASHENTAATWYCFD